MKKLLSVLSLLIVATMILAACGAPAPTEAPDVPATDAPEPTDAPATDAPAGDKVQIRWFVGLGTGTDPAQLPSQEKAVADFNASQDEIELVLEVVPFDSARDTLATQIASGAGPDIIGPVGWGGSNAFYGQWLDMTPYIESTGFDTSIYDPALIEFYQTEEGQVGLPYLVFPAAIYYVPAMFDEAGLEYPPTAYGDKYTLDGAEVDWTWETLTEVAKRLTVDVNGANATEDGFDATQLQQVGFANQWQTHVAYQASYVAGAADIVSGDEGSYESAMPDSWKEANKWVYDGMWGEQPFMATGPLAGAPEFGNGNLFNSGKAAMAMTPLWYTCCLDQFRDAGFEFQAGVLPVGADGEYHGRVDADTIRLWKGSANPEEAFKALSYLIGPEGVQTLVVGTEEVPAAYSGLPANPEFQQPYIDALLKRYPFTTAETWDVFKAGLTYPDNPSAEQWQPNWNESWARQQTFFDLLQNTPPDQLDFDAEWQKMVDDLNDIYAK
ncbi:MAG: extracellular solute-binding protein [Chloroflexi bacterium]|nr:MAG: extracellular solute-binding protein [Chloroflexota bacterium]